MNFLFAYLGHVPSLWFILSYQRFCIDVTNSRFCGSGEHNGTPLNASVKRWITFAFGNAHARVCECVSVCLWMSHTNVMLKLKTTKIRNKSNVRIRNKLICKWIVECVCQRWKYRSHTNITIAIAFLTSEILSGATRRPLYLATILVPSVVHFIEWDSRELCENNNVCDHSLCDLQWNEFGERVANDASSKSELWVKNTTTNLQIESKLRRYIWQLSPDV